MTDKNIDISSVAERCFCSVRDWVLVIAGEHIVSVLNTLGLQLEVGLLFGRFKRFFQNREEERFQDTMHFYLNHSFTIEAVKFKTKPTIIFGLPLSNPLKKHTLPYFNWSLL